MTTEEKDRIEKDTEKYFGSGPRVRYETRAGEGSGALILRFKEMEPGKNTLKRRFVIKRALEHDFDGDIENEINWLNVLRRAEHVIRMIAVRDNSDKVRRSGDAGMEGPFIILEYLENGSLAQFINASTNDGIVLPNRFVLSVFICLARICIAMAYPPGPNDSPFELPPIPDQVPSRLCHRDMHPGNLMFSHIDPRVIEHCEVPLLKIIDFGFSGLGQLSRSESPEDPGEDPQKRYIANVNKWYTDTFQLAGQPVFPGARNDGIDRNILAAGQVMVELLDGTRGLPLHQCRLKIATPGFCPTLDGEIRMLILRCLAPEAAHRPRLEELLSTLHGFLYTKTAQFYRGTAAEANETSATLQHLFQTRILGRST